MNLNNIKISVGSAEAHSNQVIERCFRTLKSILRRSLQPSWKEKQPDPLLKQPFDPEKVVLVVKEGIEFYNQKPHKALYGMSPNYMEKALFIHSKAVNFIDKEMIPPLTKNVHSVAASQNIKFKQDAIRNFQGNWAKFFVDFKNMASDGFKSLEEQNKNLYHQNLSLMKDLSLVRDEIEIMKHERKRKEQIKEKRKNAQKLNIRDSISEQEFSHIMQSIKKKKISFCAF